jgi:hypothetical protein
MTRKFHDVSFASIGKSYRDVGLEEEDALEEEVALEEEDGLVVDSVGDALGNKLLREGPGT